MSRIKWCRNCCENVYPYKKLSGVVFVSSSVSPLPPPPEAKGVSVLWQQGSQMTPCDCSQEEVMSDYSKEQESVTPRREMCRAVVRRGIQSRAISPSQAGTSTGLMSFAGSSTRLL